MGASLKAPQPRYTGYYNTALVPSLQLLLGAQSTSGDLPQPPHSPVAGRPAGAQAVCSRTWVCWLAPTFPPPGKHLGDAPRAGRPQEALCSPGRTVGSYHEQREEDDPAAPHVGPAAVVLLPLEGEGQRSVPSGAAAAPAPRGPSLTLITSGHA